MEDRTFLQMDKATSESKILLGNFTQRCESSNLYGHHHLLFSGHHKKQTQIDSLKLRDITDFKRCSTRQNTVKGTSVKPYLSRCQRTKLYSTKL